MQIARLLKTEKSILSINRLNTFSPDIDAENMDMFLSLCKPKTSSWFKNLSVGKIILSNCFGLPEKLKLLVLTSIHLCHCIPDKKEMISKP